METITLTQQERFFIEVIRKFDFLRENGYSINRCTIYGKEFGIEFVNHRLKLQIIISWLDSNDFRFSIEKQQNWILRDRGSVYFDLRDLYDKFDLRHLDVKLNSENFIELIRQNANFVKQSLMPIICGELWIQELLQHDL